MTVDPNTLSLAVTALQPHYFLTIQDIAQIRLASRVYFADHLRFRHQSPVVRAVFPGSPAPLRLTVPVHVPHAGAAIGEVLLDNHQPWVRKHLKTLFHHYRFAPYFDVYQAAIESVFTQNAQALGDFLFRLLMVFHHRLFPPIPVNRFWEMGLRNREAVKNYLKRQGGPPLLCSPQELSYYKHHFKDFPLIVVHVKTPISVTPQVSLTADSPFIVGLYYHGPAFVTELHHRVTWKEVNVR